MVVVVVMGSTEYGGTNRRKPRRTRRANKIGGGKFLKRLRRGCRPLFGGVAGAGSPAAGWCGMFVAGGAGAPQVEDGGRAGKLGAGWKVNLNLFIQP